MCSFPLFKNHSYTSLDYTVALFAPLLPFSSQLFILKSQIVDHVPNDNLMRHSIVCHAEICRPRTILIMVFATPSLLSYKNMLGIMLYAIKTSLRSTWTVFMFWMIVRFFTCLCVIMSMISTSYCFSNSARLQNAKGATYIPHISRWI